MATLSAGTSTSISLQAGKTITFPASGSGLAVIENGQDAGTSYRIGSAQVSIGPYSTPRNISVTAISDIGYFMGPQNVTLSADRAPALASPSLSSDSASAVLSATGGLPIYILGDSNQAVASREVDFSTATVVNNAFQWSGAISVPPGTSMRTYGFADSRFNFTGILQYVGGLPTLPIPSPDIPDQAIPALGTGMTLRRAQASSAWGDRGFPFWVHGTSGKRYRWRNRCRSGSDTRAFLANLATDLDAGPGVVILLGTMNDALSSVSEALTEANYRALFSEILNGGHRLIAVPNTTFSSVQAGYVALNKRQLRQAQLLRNLAREFRCDTLDMGDLQIDKTSADAVPIVGRVQADGTHWTPTLVQLGAPTLVTLLDKNGAGSTPIHLMENALDSRYDAAGAAISGNETTNNIVKNGQMAGTGSTGVAGGPDLYAYTKNVNVTLALSKIAGALGASSKTRHTMSTTGSGQDFNIAGTTVHADLPAGKRVIISGLLDVATNINYFLGFGAVLTFTSAGTDQPLQVYTTDVASPGNAMPTGTYTLTLTTPEFEVPAGYTLTSFKPYAQISARAAMTTQTFDMSQWTVDIR